MKPLLAGALFGLLSLSACDRGHEEPPAPIPVSPADAPLGLYGAAPSFEFEDQNGETFSSASLHGKVWIANVFLAHCPGKCPEMTEGVRQIHDAHAGDDRLHFVSITANPNVETVKDLSEYAARWGADPGRWHFLRSDHETTCDLISRGFKLPCDPVNPTNHAFRLVLVDRDGTIRKYYDALDAASLRALARDLEPLLAK